MSRTTPDESLLKFLEVAQYNPATRISIEGDRIRVVAANDFEAYAISKFWFRYTWGCVPYGLSLWVADKRMGEIGFISLPGPQDGIGWFSRIDQRPMDWDIAPSLEFLRMPPAERHKRSPE